MGCALFYDFPGSSDKARISLLLPSKYVLSMHHRNNSGDLQSSFITFIKQDKSDTSALYEIVSRRLFHLRIHGLAGLENVFCIKKGIE